MVGHVRRGALHPHRQVDVAAMQPLVQAPFEGGLEAGPQFGQTDDGLEVPAVEGANLDGVQGAADAALRLSEARH